MKRGLWAKEASITMKTFAGWPWIAGFAAEKPAKKKQTRGLFQLIESMEEAVSGRTEWPSAKKSSRRS